MPALLQPAIDHVVINVKDQLDAAAERFEKLGFQLTERGHHSMGSSNNLTIFGTDYLELLGFEPSRLKGHIDLLDMPSGLGGLVFKPSAAPEFRDQLAARGVPIGESREFTRPVDLPGGAKDAHFRVTHLAPEIALGGRVFFCHHFTPELVWRPEWQDHANGVTAIAEFIVATPEPERSAAPYRLIFGEAAFTAIPGGLQLTTGQGKVLLLTPQAATARFGDALPALPTDGGDRMVALVFRTASLDKARSALAAGGIAASDFEAGLLVPAGEAFGVALGFTG